jgi:hypothetical protein
VKMKPYSEKGKRKEREIWRKEGGKYESGKHKRKDERKKKEERGRKEGRWKME